MKVTFERMFALTAISGLETYYAFRFGPARSLSLKSEVPQQFTTGTGTQYQWMQSQIASLRNEPMIGFLPIGTSRLMTQRNGITGNKGHSGI